MGPLSILKTRTPSSSQENLVLPRFVVHSIRKKELLFDRLLFRSLSQPPKENAAEGASLLGAALGRRPTADGRVGPSLSRGHGRRPALGA